MKVFFDTMVYLHYRSLDQMDLTQLLGSPRYTVVVPRVTLRELDKHKGTHKSSRIRDRARRILKKIEAWTKGAEVRPGVSAEFLSSVPTLDYAASGLNPDWSDDILIATVLQFKGAHPGEEVVLVTQDSAPRITASQLGLVVLDLPAEWRLPDEPDPLEVKNRELTKTIAALQNALPKLSASFVGSDDIEQHARFILPPPPELMDHDIAEKMKELRKTFSQARPPEAAISISKDVTFTVAVTTRRFELHRPRRSRGVRTVQPRSR